VVGLAVAGRLLERRFTPAPSGPPVGNASDAGERLWVELESLLAEADCAPGALAAVAVATGPGAFTGLRVSTALAQGLGLSLGVPIVGIPSAAVFARARVLEGARGPWLVALAAKDGSAWCARARCAAEASDARLLLEDGAVLDEAGFAARLAEVAASEAELLADAHLPDALRALARAHGIACHEPRATAAALVAEALLALPDRACDPAALLPIYAREPEAVTKWRERKASAVAPSPPPGAR
jgi:tRNA threonylcarbamoyladenosine biosynthesis protein TsaB